MVILTGDGNSNSERNSFPDVIQQALLNGWPVELWTWKDSASGVYQNFQSNYGRKQAKKEGSSGFFTLRLLDQYRDKISYQIAKSELDTQYKAEIPRHLLCPITHSLMKDPVIVMASGRTYEREAIDRHMQESRGVPLDPITREPMYVSELTPNHTVRDAVAAWCMENGQ
jgi:hypothetical protein